MRTTCVPDMAWPHGCAHALSRRREISTPWTREISGPKRAFGQGMADSNRTEGAQELERITTLLAEAKHTIDDLEQKIRLARGTGDVQEEARAARAAAPEPKTLRERVELELTHASLTTQQLARAAGAAVGPVSEVLRELRDEKRVTNVGLEDAPIWTLRIGDAPATEVRNVVRRLLTERPMSHKELVIATGASDSKVQSALIEIRRSDNVMDFSAGGHARRYFVVTGEMRDARLTPRRPR